MEGSKGPGARTHNGGFQNNSSVSLKLLLLKKIKVEILKSMQKQTSGTYIKEQQKY